MNNRTSSDCGRKMEDKDSKLTDLGLGTDFQVILRIVRHFMQSVSHPVCLGWMAALADADHAFGPVLGPQIASSTLEVLHHMRLSRRSVFSFNSPSCPSCRNIVTEHERRLMTALVCDSAGMSGQTHMQLIMLCEGNDVTHVAAAMTRLNSLISALQQPNAGMQQRSVEDLQRMN